ncbi:hypothetical protein SteCoe_28477 [Stentor coeruleus]|uniref:SRR1-like domain-containing protein n=1 Tax=Stentor coeruleus TaxID=5963 RepID=A0A1R2B849_9CILI|nr:hypothetical protein SteCoe_28477 [Stentor coeruleus]
MDWQVVSKKSKSRIRSHQTSTASSLYKVSFLSFCDTISASKKDKSLISLSEKCSEICEGTIIAVGIGNFSSALYSTSQQALYELLIQDKGQIGVFFDPGYLPSEVEYLEEQKWQVNQGVFNQEQTGSCTFFMIHCHYSLYETLLSSPWVSQCRVTIIGNSLNDMVSKFKQPSAISIASTFHSSKLETIDLAFVDTFISKNFTP